jgi:hypothetical protein
MRFAIARSLAQFGVVTLAACGDQNVTAPKITPIATASLTKSQGATGTTLKVQKSATGFRESRLDYDWTLTKHVKAIMDDKPERGGMYALPSTSEVEIPRGETRWIEYEISATRDQGTMRIISGVRGQICVTNSGQVATKDLRVVDVIRTSAGLALKSVALDVSAKPVLQAGETYCYRYEIPMDVVAGAQYQNVAQVTITNAIGHEGSEFNPYGEAAGATAQFSIPSMASQGPPIDATALVRDGLNVDNVASRSGPCAEHFYLYYCSTNTEQDPWKFTGTGTVEFMVDINNTFACGDSFDFTNTAILEEGAGIDASSHTLRNATAVVRVTSGPCPPGLGCTLTKGYWKQTFHDWPGMGLYPNQPTRYDIEFFDSHRSWQETLDAQPERGDPYIRLAQQYIAATLNRANGAAMPNNVREAYAAAAHWFSIPPQERALISDELLNSWASLLASYNEGKQGVPHCGDEACTGNKKTHTNKDHGHQATASSQYVS